MRPADGSSLLKLFRAQKIFFLTSFCILCLNPFTVSAQTAAPVSNETEASSANNSDAEPSPIVQQPSSAIDDSEPEPLAIPDAESLQQDLSEPITEAIGSQIFFDADKTSFNKSMTHQIFEGNVVAIGAGTLIAADYLAMDKTTNIVTAKGHIVLINRSVIFLGDDLTYHIVTGDMKLGKATMYSNNSEVVAEATSNILGFTAKEVAFEAERKKRLSEVGKLKERLRIEARRQMKVNGKVPDDLIEKYAVYLEQEELIKKQENQTLARLAEDKRDSFKRRRNFWETSQKSGLAVSTNVATSAYFHIEGETLVKVNGNDFYARNSLFTPCYCKPGESPAWAFNASEIEAQVGGYANLYHPVLQIKGIPVLYLPWLKFPLKDRRQSGFLMPTFGYEERSGNIYSQPVYFDFGPDSDATVTTDIYERRGTRLGVEYRLQQKQFSGWEMQAETIRDRLWLEDREVRRELRSIYTEGLNKSLTNPAPEGSIDLGLNPRDYLEARVAQKSHWENLAKQYPGATLESDAPAIQNDINTYLDVPENTWRGAYGWRGVTYLAPRLSFTSAGQINSDHRYAEELYVPEDFEDVIFGGRNEPSFATSKGQFHVDGRDLYLGLGTRFGDNYLTDERFEGQQLPLRFKMQTLYFSLLPDRSIVPAYGQVSLEHYRIAEYQSKTEERYDTPTLGGGSWRRLKADFVSPWVTDSIVQVNQFTDAEARYIEHKGLSSKSSEIKSWRAGLEFRLPIDGKGVLPDMFQADICTEEKELEGECTQQGIPDGKRNIHHLMDWRLKFSVRPSVVRVGPYTEGLEPAGEYAYFTGDKESPVVDLDREVLEEDRMREHRRISLMTDHVWKLFNKDWQRIAASGDDKVPPSKDSETSSERARRELLFNLERPVTSESEIFDENTNEFLVDRYRLFEQYYLTPMTFSADIAYDFLDAELREKQKKEKKLIQTDLSSEVATLAYYETRIAAARAENQTETITTLEAQIQTQKALVDRLKKDESAIVLVEPWKEVNANWGLNYSGFGLGTSVVYNLYAKTARIVNASLTFPAVFKTNLNIGYTQEKTISTGNATRTRVRSYRLASSLIPMVQTYASVSQKLQDALVRSYTDEYKTAFGFRYDSDSKCWGLQFAREKNYGKLEGEATYLLRLSVVFMGQQRNLPNMSQGLEREFKDDDES